MPDGGHIGSLPERCIQAVDKQNLLMNKKDGSIRMLPSHLRDLPPVLRVRHPVKEILLLNVESNIK